MAFGPALARLDALLRAEVLAARAAAAVEPGEAGGWFVSDARVDALLAEPPDRPPAADELSRRADGLAVAATAALHEDDGWRAVCTAWALDAAAEDVLMLALAAELDLRYATVFGYLNDDLTQRWPTRELALRIHGPAVGAAVDDAGPLIAGGLLDVVHAPERRPWPADGLCVAPAVRRRLLGEPPADRAIAFTPASREARDGGARGEPGRRAPSAAGDDTLAGDEGVRPELVDELASAVVAGVPLVALEGARGSGRLRTVVAVASRLGLPLLHFDAALQAEPPAAVAERAALLARLHGALVHVRSAEALVADAAAFAALADRCPCAGAVVLSLPRGADPDALTGRRVARLTCSPPPAPDRRARWARALAANRLPLPPPELDALAERFALGPGQVDRAARLAADAHAAGDVTPTDAAFAAARRESRGALAAVAAAAPGGGSWEELVLPAPTLRKLREVAGSLRRMRTVYDAWGMGGGRGGAGINVLFAGPSGTGKTLAARVLAGELGLELFTVLIPGLVSKYIGETERNLDRVFDAARDSSALLLFDEADALFGKRSEVRDARDRYANIEVAYLLQKLEQHESGVILATNLTGHLDPAFSRRMHHVVEFPLPGEQERERMWRGAFAARTPLGSDVDYGFLARQFAVAGGDIRAAALAAAFLAADDGRVVRMEHIVRAMARQLEKRGRTPSALEFQRYHALLKAAP